MESVLAEVALVCADPHCQDSAGQRSIAEPEQDGDHKFLVCSTCGYHFGYRRITSEVQSTSSCVVGIPETLRRVVSAPAEQALTHSSDPPLIQIGRRPDAPAA